MMPAIADIVGGEATRLYPLTLNKPKFMLEVAGKPFIYHQLSLFKQNGISDVVLCTGRLSEQIEKYVGDGSAWGLKVRYANEGPIPLGTGGTIKRAIPQLPDEFFVIYGDSYLDIPFKPVYERFKAEKKQALMTVYHNKDLLGRSNTVFKDGKIIMYDKVNHPPEMEYIDYGLSLMKKSVFDDWPEGKKFDLSEVYTKLLERQELAAFEVSSRFYEIGSFEGLKETEQYLNTRKSD